MGKRNLDRIAIPDLVLRDAYLSVGRRVECWREKFAAKTENIEAVKLELGPRYAHVPTDWIRDRILTCCKNPSGHGGGWKGTKNGHGPGKIPESPQWYREYLKSDEWIAVRHTVLRFWDFSCSLCNCTKLVDVHHRRYERLNGTEQHNDCIALCRKCHKRHHRWCSIPENLPHIEGRLF